MKRALNLSKEDYSEVFRDIDSAIPVGYELLDKIFPGVILEQELHVCLPFKARMGHLSRDELLFLVGIVNWKEPETVFEIGTFDGLTTVNIAANSPEDCIIHTLDIPEKELIHSRFKIDAYNQQYIMNSDRFLYINRFKQLSRKINILEGDSGRFDFSPYYNSIDLVFIDGSHTYDYCYSDSMNAFKMVSDGGVVLWHDYNKTTFNANVIEVVNKLSREMQIPIYWFNDRVINGGKTSFVFYIKNSL